MNDTPDPHPSAAQLTAFDTGQLAGQEREAVEQHVHGCPECCRTLDALPEDPLVAVVRAFAGRHESTAVASGETDPAPRTSRTR
jgi:hypothetical protein